MALQLVEDPDRPASRWTWEAARGHTRAVRISPHAAARLVNLSVWREDRCVGSLRLSPDEVARLIGELSTALAALAAAPSGEEVGNADLGGRVAALEGPTPA